ncbi:hypothetical protein BJ741DRAFT_581880 [Chytriomyces cf. hyalinus JEL632]|nr:hypothetical protein BJ741DRAFT_581880 [Chytriomyces cf. hyalinus JEL632]
MSHNVVVIRDSKANLCAIHYGTSSNVIFYEFTGLPNTVRLDGGYFMSTDAKAKGISFGRDEKEVNHQVKSLVSMNVSANQIYLGTEGWNFSTDPTAIKMRCDSMDLVVVNRDITTLPCLQVEGGSRVNGHLTVTGNSTMDGNVYLSHKWAIVASKAALHFRHWNEKKERKDLRHPK